MAWVLRPGGRVFAATNGAWHMQEARLLAMEAERMSSTEVKRATLQRPARSMAPINCGRSSLTLPCDGMRIAWP